MTLPVLNFLGIMPQQLTITDIHVIKKSCYMGEIQV